MPGVFRMIMQKTWPNIIYLVLAFLLLSFPLYSAEPNLSDEETAKRLLLNKTLHCNFKELWYDGPEYIQVKEISGNQFKGFSKFWCHAKGVNYTGSLSKNVLKFDQDGTSAQTCYCRSGSIKFYYEQDSLKAEGKYKVGCGATPAHGTIKCNVIDTLE